MTTTKHFGLTETAKEIRATLKAAFPDTKFSVTTKRYAGGSSIDVRYTDGPVSKDVDAVVSLFEGKGFDGMDDSSYSKPAVSYKGELVTFNWGYLHVSRSVSDALIQVAAYRAHKATKLPLLEVQGHRVLGGGTRTEFHVSNGEIVAGQDGRYAGGESYERLVYSLAYQLATPHATGEADIPQIVRAELAASKDDSVATIH